MATKKTSQKKKTVKKIVKPSTPTKQHKITKKLTPTKVTKTKKVTKKKSKTINKVEKEQILYMGISNPVEIRKLILENARDMVHLLQLFEKFKIIREEKSEATKLLKKEVKALNTLISRLKSVLPKTSIRARQEERDTVEEKTSSKKLPKQNYTKKITPRIKEPEEMPEEIEIDDLEALESELKEIEDRLNFL